MQPLPQDCRRPGVCRPSLLELSPAPGYFSNDPLRIPSTAQGEKLEEGSSPKGQRCRAWWRAPRDDGSAVCRGGNVFGGFHRVSGGSRTTSQGEVAHVAVCSRSQGLELSPGQMKMVVADRERLLLVNMAGTFYAINHACGHECAPLSRGKLEGHVVVCPRHFARYDVRTGQLLSGPLADDVPVYEIRIEEDTVYVKL